MGITPLTLGHASTEGHEILDHKSGEKVKVICRFVNGKPVFQFKLVYPSGFECDVKWQDGQGFPGYLEGKIHLIRGGHGAWKRQNGKQPAACTKP